MIDRNLTAMEEMDIDAHALTCASIKTGNGKWMSCLPGYRVNRILNSINRSGSKIELYAADFNALLDALEATKK